jgi:hypothetical protein
MVALVSVSHGSAKDCFAPDRFTAAYIAEKEGGPLQKWKKLDNIIQTQLKKNKKSSQKPALRPPGRLVLRF